MILLTNEKEAAVLLLTMSTMRESVKKQLKKQHAAKKKEFLKAFDYIKEQLTTQLEEEQAYKELHLNITDIQALDSFLSAYIPKLDSFVEKAKLTEAEDLFYLRKIKKDCERLINEVA